MQLAHSQRSSNRSTSNYPPQPFQPPRFRIPNHFDIRPSPDTSFQNFQHNRHESAICDGRPTGSVVVPGDAEDQL